MSRVLADNWSLQNVAELLTSGLGNDQASLIKIDKQKNSHNYVDINYDVIRLEALFDLINDIVLKDELVVDERFIGSWKKLKSPLSELQEAGIIQPFAFLDSPEKLKYPREQLVTRLCATPTLTSEHLLNESIWRTDRKTPFPVLSSVLWGGAGMLARSHVYECNYTPHPLRRRFFADTGIFKEKSNATESLHTLVSTKRLQLFGGKQGNGSLYSAFINISPIPLRVIEESSDISDVLRISLELRKEMKELREWLNQFQNAVDNEDVDAVIKHEKLLDSVSQYVDQRVSGGASKRVNMSLGIGFLKFTLNVDPIIAIQNKVGVRSSINSLIFDKPGKQALKKLLGFFGDSHSIASYPIYEHFAKEPQ